MHLFSFLHAMTFPLNMICLLSFILHKHPLSINFLLSLLYIIIPKPTYCEIHGASKSNLKTLLKKAQASENNNNSYCYNNQPVIYL